MDNIKQLVRKNLIIKIDFENRYKKSEEEGIEVITKFYLIGVLPVVIIYSDGKKERANISKAIETPRDPSLRLIHGKRLPEVEDGLFMDRLDEIADELESAFLKVILEGVFNNKMIERILIINYQEKNETDGDDKNRDNKAVSKKCQKTSDQAD